MSAPFIPLWFGPFRRAALQEAKAGMCAMCGERPLAVKQDGRLKHRFTCGAPDCSQGWRNACTSDKRFAAKQAQQTPRDRAGRFLSKESL